MKLHELTTKENLVSAAGISAAAVVGGLVISHLIVNQDLREFQTYDGLEGVSRSNIISCAATPLVSRDGEFISIDVDTAIDTTATVPWRKAEARPGAILVINPNNTLQVFDHSLPEVTVQRFSADPTDVKVGILTDAATIAVCSIPE